jgi:hypothetical protein
MKRTLIAVAVALLASPALALEVGPPFEQNELDRKLPDIQFAPVAPYVADARAPYEQLVIDRALPNLPERATQFARAAGDTRTDAGPDDQAPVQAPAGSLWARGPWAHDWNFIAPPQ